jgi:para-aminobenzoate synthetase/4-amino-4-deoxychorismate lyase
MPLGECTQDCFALFDDDHGTARLLSGYRRSFSFDGNLDGAALDAAFAAAEMAVGQGEWVALAASYELGALLEPAVRRDSTRQPLLRGWVFGQSECLDAAGVTAFLHERLSRLSDQQRVAGIAEVRPELDLDGYVKKVQQIRRWIAEGDCYQINLTFPLRFRYFGHPLALYAGLRRRQPVRHGGYLSVPGGPLLSLSPELFFERRGRRVVTRPMKGTAPRGSTPIEDAENRCALLASAKERAENIMIVDLLRNDLGRLADAGKVRVDALCEAEAYPTLWQSVSTVSAELPDVGLRDLFTALFPCGSITGAPKIRAMQRIAELEDSPRGIYTGSIGWLAPGGDCRFNVAIRTPELGGDGFGRLGIGGGIVIDAQPAREYAECLLKARFLTGFDPGFELIETLRLEQGRYPFLELHLQRLSSSAVALGFACPMSEIRDALQRRAAGNGVGLHRVRLTLAHSGEWGATSVAFLDDPLPKSATIASEVLDPSDYMLRHKTSARSRYDGALKSLEGVPGAFDAIFLNSRGEVCEGARSNVFVERDGVLLTPPLHCGLLPGVLRRHLLESGRAVEGVLTREDLFGDASVYLGNALRGLVRVTVSPRS